MNRMEEQVMRDLFNTLILSDCWMITNDVIAELRTIQNCREMTVMIAELVRTKQRFPTEQKIWNMVKTITGKEPTERQPSRLAGMAATILVI